METSEREVEYAADVRTNTHDVLPGEVSGKTVAKSQLIRHENCRIECQWNSIPVSNQ